jgi:hypothetical protein
MAEMGMQQAGCRVQLAVAIYSTLRDVTVPAQGTLHWQAVEETVLYAGVLLRVLCRPSCSWSASLASPSWLWMPWEGIQQSGWQMPLSR